MKNKLFKVIMLFIIASLFAAPAFARGNQNTQTVERGPDGLPTYLNTGTTLPIVKPGHTVTLSFLAPMDDDYGGKTEDLWFWEYVRRIMNIQVSVEQVLESAIEQRRALLFAAGNLPDIMFELGLNTVDIMNYGVRDKQLLNIANYLNPQVAPNLMNSFQRTPAARAALTAPDGGIYAWASIGQAINTSGMPDFFINTTWLRQLGLQKPNTLDEYYNALVAFRDRDPSGTGRIIPLGGSNSYANPNSFLLSAYGFLIRYAGQQPAGVSYYTEPALRNGRVEIPAGSPLFRDYLTFMNRLYTERLIDPDFFTDGSVQVRQKIQERRVGSMHESMTTNIPEYSVFSNWEALSPLTSASNPTKQAGRLPAPITIRDVASANTNHPELVMRFMDWFYDPEGLNQAMAWNGPPPGDLTFGMFKGFVYTPDWTEYYQDVEDGLYPGAWELILMRLAPFTSTHGDQSDRFNSMRVLSGLPRVGERGYRHVENMQFANNYYTNSMNTNVRPYGVDAFPTMVYFTPQQSQRLADLRTVINNFVEQEAARFITGANSLNNFNTYMSQLEALGFREYESIYQTIYTNYRSNQR